MTSFNGQTITCDAIGNPLQYRDGYNFTWSNGRQLTGVINGTNTYGYTYDADGLRTSKTVNGTTTNYYWANGVLQAQKTGSEYIVFLYDDNGSAYGLLLKNGTTEEYYYYIYNAQGDVIGILNSAGTQVVSYEYGAWGEILSTTGTLASTIGQSNPLRYRGYYYDAETGFYYLRSRYYDSTTQRFLNADGYVSTGQGVLDNNMFAYCMNNPVNLLDDDGNLPKWLKGALNVVSGTLQAAAGIALISTVGWTGVGGAVGTLLMLNGAATITQGIGQIVNDVTKSNTLREDNIVRTAVQDVGYAVGGEKGAQIAGSAYDGAIIASSIYAGTVSAKKLLDKNMSKIVESKLFSFNDGWGIKIGKHIEILYKNPNAAGGPGGTIFSYDGPLGKFRIDWDPTFRFHTHPPGHK